MSPIAFHTPVTTMISAALLGLNFVVLTVLVIRQCGKSSASLGDSAAVPHRCP